MENPEARKRCQMSGGSGERQRRSERGGRLAPFSTLFCTACARRRSIASMRRYRVTFLLLVFILSFHHCKESSLPRHAKPGAIAGEEPAGVIQKSVGKRKFQFFEMVATHLFEHNRDFHDYFAAPDGSLNLEDFLYDMNNSRVVDLGHNRYLFIMEQTGATWWCHFSYIVYEDGRYELIQVFEEESKYGINEDNSYRLGNLYFTELAVTGGTGTAESYLYGLSFDEKRMRNTLYFPSNSYFIFGDDKVSMTTDFTFSSSSIQLERSLSFNDRVIRREKSELKYFSNYHRYGHFLARPLNDLQHQNVSYSKGKQYVAYKILEAQIDNDSGTIRALPGHDYFVFNEDAFSRFTGDEFVRNFSVVK